MIALDFFLYDNQTWSPRWGRDWGLKAATGKLATRADLRAAFDRYCGLTPGEQGQISGFGEAIGGVRSQTGDGYLLCVTLETSDSFGRPSWAVCGLWCPDSSAVELALSASDPIGSARALLGAEVPSNAVEIRNGKLAIVPRRRLTSSGPAFHLFAPQSTVREAIAFLLGALRSGTALPNILGITATPRLENAARMGFDVVYGHPMEERAERALARVLSSPEPDEDEPLRPLVSSKPLATGSAVASRAWGSTLRSSLWLLLLSMGIAGMVAVFLLVSDWRRNASTSLSKTTSRDEEAPVAGEKPPRVNSAAQSGSAETALWEMGERLEECKRLVPDELRRSASYTAAETLEVLPEHRAKRNRVRQAYLALLEIRERMVKRQGKNYVAYYFNEAGKDTAPDLRLQRITTILAEAPLGGEDCKVLREAFAFELEDEGSAVRQWCDSLQRLDQTASRIRSVSYN